MGPGRHLRKQIEETLQRKAAQIKAVTEGMAAYLETGDFRAASAILLKAAIRYTHSKYGFIGVVTPGPTLRVLNHEGAKWHLRINREFFDETQRRYREEGFLEFKNLDNLFGKVITTGKPVIANRPGRDPQTGSLPAGNPPLNSFLGVPFLVGGEVIGMIGLADRPKGYRHEERRAIETITQAAAFLFDSYRWRQKQVALEQVHAESQRALAEVSLVVRSLRDSENQFLGVLDAAADAVISIDEAQRIVLFSKGAEMIFGYSAAEILGRPVNMLIPGRFGKAHESHVRHFAGDDEGTRLMGERRSIFGLRKDGTEFPAEASITKVRHDGWHTFTVILRDITDRVENQEAIQYQATHDALTGLPNRRFLRGALGQAIASYDQVGRPLALIVIDLDRFAEINDTLGHRIGDLVLREVGLRFRAAFWEKDTVARLGNDEFGVLTPVAKKEDVASVADKIAQVLNRSVVIEEIPIHIEATVGIAVALDHGEDADLIFRRAEVALNVAKKLGVGWMIYAEELNQHSVRRLALMGELRRAIESDQLRLHYQPQIDLGTRKVIGAEALVRWEHPVHGFVPPVQFIEPAEQTGLIRPLTAWVIHAALCQLVAFRDAGISLPVSVNISARNLMDGTLPEFVAREIEAARLPAKLLEIEITESAILSESGRVAEVIARLSDLGIAISVDDFGVGQTSLSHLRRLPVRALKIDRSFVLDLMKTGHDAVIVRSMIDLGHNLGLRVIAEGVETEEVLERLAQFGCDAAQGYFMCRPIPPDALQSWLRDSPWGVLTTS